MTRDQYKALNSIRKRTDSIIDGEVKFESFLFPTEDDWKFFEKNNFIEGVKLFSSVTFQGRVALAVYEADNVDARSI